MAIEFDNAYVVRDESWPSLPVIAINGEAWEWQWLPPKQRRRSARNRRRRFRRFDSAMHREHRRKNNSSPRRAEPIQKAWTTSMN